MFNTSPCVDYGYWYCCNMTVCLQEMSPDNSPAYIDDYKELLGACRKNYLSKALLLMQKSLLLSTAGVTTTEQKGLLQVGLKKPYTPPSTHPPFLLHV